MTESEMVEIPKIEDIHPHINRKASKFVDDYIDWLSINYNVDIDLCIDALDTLDKCINWRIDEIKRHYIQISKDGGY